MSPAPGHGSKRIDEDGNESEPAKPLSCGTITSYGFLRLPISAYDFLIRPARVTVYRETLGMSIKTQAMLVAACKSVDFLIGFFVGSLSDRTRTRWGRRKPFIMFMAPVMVVASTLFCWVPESLGTPERDLSDNETSCEAFVGNDTISNSSSCPVLSDCLRTAVDAGWLPPALHPWTPTYNETTFFDKAGQGAGSGLSLWFALFYFLYYAAGVTSVVIPYDALGMELTTDYNEKSKLFGIKAAFQYAGYLFQVILNVVLAGMFPTSIITQARSASYIVGVLYIVAIGVLVSSVRERPPTPVTEVPIVPGVRRLFANRPYMMYLLFRIPMTLASLLPSNLLGDYIHYCMKVEDWNTLQSFTFATVILSIFVSIPFLVWAAKRYGKREVLASTCLFDGTVLLICFFIPPESMKGGLIFILGAVVGFGMAASFVIPDSVLADVIDYDELHTNERNEAMYTVVETNLQQFVEILGGVLPGVVAGMYGFESNGGCSCGCGVECRVKFARWDCPSDLGLACTDDLDAHLLFADPDRVAPCTIQPDSVQNIYRMFFLLLPALMYLSAAWPAWQMAISKEVHGEILQQIAKRKQQPSYEPIDPLTSKKVLPRNTSVGSVKAAHFNAFEHRAAQRGSGTHSLRRIAGGRLSLWVLAAVGIIVAAVATGGNEAVMTFGSLLLAAIFVLIPWEVLRLKALKGVPSGTAYWTQMEATAASSTPACSAAGYQPSSLTRESV